MFPPLSEPCTHSPGKGLPLPLTQTERVTVKNLDETVKQPVPTKFQQRSCYRIAYFFAKNACRNISLSTV